MASESDKVSVTINGRTVWIEREAWDVLMRAVNLMVDSGDIMGFAADITRGLLAKARMASGALHLTAHRPHHPATQPDEFE